MEPKPIVELHTFWASYWRTVTNFRYCWKQHLLSLSPSNMYSYFHAFKSINGKSYWPNCICYFGHFFEAFSLSQHAIASCKEWLHHLLLFYFSPISPISPRVTNHSTLKSNMHILCGCESPYAVHFVVMRNNRLINKCTLLWYMYVDVLVSVSPFRKTSRAAQVTNLGLNP